MSDVIAIFCADLHLSHTPPLARSGEPDWYAAMKRPLDELRDLAEEHHAPIICAGDIFEKWNSPPELINFAIKHLPEMYTIPGQHDLPHHRLEDIERSAYWTLVEAGTIREIVPHTFTVIDADKLILRGFPWGVEAAKRYQGLSDRTPLYVAVIHQYVGMPGSMYPGAPQTASVSSPALQDKLEGYGVAVFGDNHIGFGSYVGGCLAYNCGTLMRRKSDEINYKPGVGLLHENGTVKTHYLDTSEDVIEAVEKPTDDELDISEFVEELNGLGGDFLEFADAVERYVKSHGIKQCVNEVIQRVMEG